MTFTIIVIVMVDFLIYQARFQLNDIRGLHEDKEAGKTSRLPYWAFGVKKAVFISLLIIIVRLSIFALMAFWIDEAIQFPVLVCVSLVVIITIFYEVARAKKSIIPVFVLVSLGYPLRFFIGFWVAYPEFWGQTDLVIFLSVVLLSYAFFGEFSVLLIWTHEAISQQKAGRQFTKRHYAYLYQQVEHRGNFPLYNNGKLLDIWNWTFLISVATLSVICIMTYEFPVIVECVLLLSLVLVCFASKRQSYVVAFLMLGIAAYKIVWGYLTAKPETIYIAITQFLFMAIYYFLRFIFDPDFDFSLFCKNLAKKALILIISKKTWDLLNDIAQ